MAICGMPASLYTREAGMVVPELKCPSMPWTLASGICCATCTAVRGSAWSVLGYQDKLGFVSIQFDALGVGFFQCQRQTIAHVFTVVGLGACQRGGKAQAHRGFCVGCTHQAAKGASECQSAGHGLKDGDFFMRRCSLVVREKQDCKKA